MNNSIIQDYNTSETMLPLSCNIKEPFQFVLKLNAFRRNGIAYLIILLLSAFLPFSCKPTQLQVKKSNLQGNWIDDYNIAYEINASTWKMDANMIFHVKEWNEAEQYLIVKNGKANTYNANQFSRIDYVLLKDMSPFEWAFCLSAYDKATAKEARKSSAANTSQPKTGCNGFPFSRMKRIN